MAIIAIIGAIMVPNFMGTTDKARIKSDIQSARIIQNAADLYDAEQGTPLKRNNGAVVDIAFLQDKGYLNKDLAGMQVDGAIWVYENQKVKVDINDCTTEIKDICTKLSKQEKSMITPAVGSGDD